MRSLFVMDPLDRLNLQGDSTFMLMLESSRRGWETWWCTPDDLYATGGRGQARAQRVVTREAPAGFERFETADQPLGDFALVWMRKDPPFHMDYIFTTYLLEMAPRTTLVLNDPVSVRSDNEKLFAFTFPDLTPPPSSAATGIASSPSRAPCPTVVCSSPGTAMAAAACSSRTGGTRTSAP